MSLLGVILSESSEAGRCHSPRCTWCYSWVLCFRDNAHSWFSENAGWKLVKILCFVFILARWSLNSGLCICKASTPQLEPHLQFILFWLFLEMGGSHELFAGAGSPDFSLQVARIIGPSHQHSAYSQILNYIKEKKNPHMQRKHIGRNVLKWTLQCLYLGWLLFCFI
jgi:hypothetical protein